MNENNGIPKRRPAPGSRPAPRPSDPGLAAAANRAARRAQENNAPRAPLNRRSVPLDRSMLYDDDLQTGTEELYNTRGSDNRSEPPLAVPDRASAAAEKPVGDMLDDSFLDEPDTYPSVPAKTQEPDTVPAVPGKPDDSLEKLFAGEQAESAGQQFAFDEKRNGGARPRTGKKAAADPVKKTRKPRASRFSRKTKVIITVILLFIAANIIWISVWLFNNYTMIGGHLYGLETTELDLSGQDISAVAGITRLGGLRYLDLTGNDISIRQYKRLAKKLPECEIIWDVPVGGGHSVGNTVSDADLSSSDGIRISGLDKALPYMTALRRLDLSGCGLKDEKLYELERANRNVDLVWDVDILGREISTDADVITVGNVSVEELEDIAGKIKYFDKLHYLDLSGSGLSENEMYEFALAHPEANAAWETELFGQTCYTNASELHFEASDEMPITDISGLRYFYKLQSLTINNGNLADLSPLGELRSLRLLSLTRCWIKDISVLRDLPELVYLNLNVNWIEDVSPLSGLSNLEELHLNSNELSDISPLSGLEKLKILNVQDNHIASLAGFGNMPSLETLSLRNNQLAQVEDAEALFDIPSLRLLDLQQNAFRLSVEEEFSKKFSQANPDCTLYIWQ